MCRSESNPRKVALSFHHVLKATEFRPAVCEKDLLNHLQYTAEGDRAVQLLLTPSPKCWDCAPPCLFPYSAGNQTRTSYTRQAPSQVLAACFLNDCHSNWGEMESGSNFNGEGCKTFPHTCWLFVLCHLRALPLLLCTLIHCTACFPGI